VRRLLTGTLLCFTLAVGAEKPRWTAPNSDGTYTAWWCATGRIDPRDKGAARERICRDAVRALAGVSARPDSRYAWDEAEFLVRVSFDLAQWYRRSFPDESK